jgi:hypothetical protein
VQERRAAARGETYGGQTRKERSADRRARLVAAAVRLFAPSVLDGLAWPPKNPAQAPDFSDLYPDAG